MLAKDTGQRANPHGHMRVIRELELGKTCRGQASLNENCAKIVTKTGGGCHISYL